MKTAMQTLLEDIEFLMPRTYKVLKKKFELETFYIEKEKQQIIDAHYHGSEEPYSLSTGANKYYNETFS